MATSFNKGHIYILIYYLIIYLYVYILYTISYIMLLKFWFGNKHSGIVFYLNFTLCLWYVVQGGIDPKVFPAGPAEIIKLAVLSRWQCHGEMLSLLNGQKILLLREYPILFGFGFIKRGGAKRIQTAWFHWWKKTQEDCAISCLSLLRAAARCSSNESVCKTCTAPIFEQDFKPP